jgi:hypothetical protein
MYPFPPDFSSKITSYRYWWVIRNYPQQVKTTIIVLFRSLHDSDGRYISGEARVAFCKVVHCNRVFNGDITGVCLNRRLVIAIVFLDLVCLYSK